VIPAERRRAIIEIIEIQNSVTVANLCERLDVSEMTVRRDLRMLNNEGLIQRVHGGAVSRRGRSYETPFRIRETVNKEKKLAIASETLKLICEGDSLAIDVGTTTLCVAEGLVGIPNLTVVTSSLHVANVLSDAPNMRVILSGGILRDQEKSMVGHIAERVYSDFHVDKAIIGIGGINVTNGLTEYNLEDALVKRAILENSEQNIILTDSTKLGRKVFSQVASLSVVDVIITDWNAPDEIINELEELGIEVIIAQQN